MKWDADCLLALFLCLVFVLVVAYGAFSFGGDMGKCWFGQMVLIVFFGLYDKKVPENRYLSVYMTFGYLKSLAAL